MLCRKPVISFSNRILDWVQIILFFFSHFSSFFKTLIELIELKKNLIKIKQI